MSKDALKKRLEGIPKKDVAKAQERFNQLCIDYGLEPWDFDYGHPEWRELCFRMAGLPPQIKEPKKRGRDKLHKKEFEEAVAERFFAHKYFSDLDEDGNETEPLKTKEILKKVVKEMGIKPSRKNGDDVEAFTKPEEVVRGINNREIKKYKEELKKEREEWSE